jgi:hypothetical protein
MRGFFISVLENLNGVVHLRTGRFTPNCCARRFAKAAKQELTMHFSIGSQMRTKDAAFNLHAKVLSAAYDTNIFDARRALKSIHNHRNNRKCFAFALSLNKFPREFPFGNVTRISDSVATDFVGVTS